MGTDSPSTSSHGDRDEQLSITYVVGPCLAHLKSVLVSCVVTSSQLQGTHNTAVGQRGQGSWGTGVCCGQLWRCTHAQPRAYWSVAKPWTAKQWQGDAPVSLQRGK